MNIEWDSKGHTRRVNPSFQNLERQSNELEKWKSINLVRNIVLKYPKLLSWNRPINRESSLSVSELRHCFAFSFLFEIINILILR